MAVVEQWIEETKKELERGVTGMEQQALQNWLGALGEWQGKAPGVPVSEFETRADALIDAGFIIWISNCAADIDALHEEVTGQAPEVSFKIS